MFLLSRSKVNFFSRESSGETFHRKEKHELVIGSCDDVPSIVMEGGGVLFRLHRPNAGCAASFGYFQTEA